MPAYDSRLELAPRDVVARAIQDQMLSRDDPHVLLDISHKPRAEVLSHFPNIAARCAEQGIDITRDPIPVLPAQHYMCGGVAAGLRGETSIQGLFACGEVACSGLHGANRLASNSLLEGLVFADRAAGPSVAHAEYAARHCARQLHYAGASADFSGSRGARPLAAPTAQWVAAKRAEVKALMWTAAGIVRRTAALEAAQAALAGACLDVRSACRAHGVSTALVELLNLVTVAELIVSCALQRRESRGLHFCPDFPHLEPAAVPSVINSTLKARLPGLAPLSMRSSSSSSSSSSAGSSSSSSSIVPLPAPGSPKKGAPAPSAKQPVVARDLSVRSQSEPEK
jgi:L-aspartate oxidase